MFKIIKSCRACNADGLVDILDLGIQPLANSLVRAGENKICRFPLSLAFCPKCSLVQIRETVSKEILFDHYVWVTGTSQGAREYAKLFAQRVIDRARLKPDDFVLEIASNDGTVLKSFAGHGMKVLGIEPARNITDIAIQDGVRTDCSYWNEATSERIIMAYGHPKVVIARNVIPHVSDLHGVIKGIAQALTEDGTGVIEFHSGQVIAQELQYDSIYHEHLCYFTIYSLSQLLKQYGLFPYAVDKSPISGGAIVLYFSKLQHPAESEYFGCLGEEKTSGINEQVTWEKFAREAVIHREKTLALLKSLKGKRIVGFGSSARSATFTNFCGIGKETMKAIIDNNKIKQGWMVPAGDVPIVSFEQGMALHPDVIFVLAWNFGKEIMEECSRRGFIGQYIMPFPRESRLISSCERKS